MWRVKLAVCLVAALMLGLLLREAFGTPSRSDDTAVGVLWLWAFRALLGSPRGPGVAAAGSHGPRILRPAAAALGWMTLGLLLYWLSLRLPDAAPATGRGLGNPPAGWPRPAVVVTSATNPVFVGRVVAVGRDLTLIVDGGVAGAASGGTGTRNVAADRAESGLADIVSLSGVNTFECDREAAEAAARALKGRVLGRLVVVEVTGWGGEEDGVLAQGVGKAWPPRVRAIVYAEENMLAGAAGGEPLNDLVAAILDPSGEADPRADVPR
ncbi:MAG: hypothetical protein C4551_00195 [Bacillota bacterium]|nr:MAG: hypothetical protein C4551_00195 [Bacillota bacterium]